MYTSFYNLDEKPFQVSSDSSFIWLGEKQKEALETFRYGIMDNKGFLLLTGDVGTGKTTFIHALISSLNDEVIYASIPDPRLETLDFLNYIALAFGINQEFTSKGAFIVAFSHFLQKAYEQKKRVLLAIDESQLLSRQLLEEIRLLSNLNNENSALLNIFFVGQTKFNEVISSPENRAISHRLSLRYNLEPLNMKETREYIDHRLKKSGSITEIFNHSATKEIYSSSGGLPRQINILCDHCLITGYKAEKKVITGTDVQACLKDLSIPVYGNTVIYQEREREHSDDFIDYVPSSMLFESSPDMESGNEEHREDERTGYFDSAETELLPEPVTDRKKKTVVLSIGAVFLCIMALVILYSTFPAPFVTLYDSIVNSRSSADYENTSSKDDSVGNTSSITISEIDHSSSLSSDNRVVQHKIIGPTTSLEPDDKPQAENQSPSGAGSARETVPLEGAVAGVDSTTLIAGKGDLISNKLQADTAPHQPKEQPVPRIPEQTLIIKFDINSAQFSSLDHDLIKEYVEYLIGTPSSIAVIAGYTDSSGSSDYNHLISKFRAEIVMGYIMGKGVPKSQIKVYGFGPKNPIASNETEEGREMNRRVEVSLLSE